MDRDEGYYEAAPSQSTVVEWEEDGGGGRVSTTATMTVPDERPSTRGKYPLAGILAGPAPPPGLVVSGRAPTVVVPGAEWRLTPAARPSHWGGQTVWPPPPQEPDATLSAAVAQLVRAVDALDAEEAEQAKSADLINRNAERNAACVTLLHAKRLADAARAMRAVDLPPTVTLDLDLPTWSQAGVLLHSGTLPRGIAPVAVRVPTRYMASRILMPAPETRAEALDWIDQSVRRAGFVTRCPATPGLIGLSRPILCAACKSRALFRLGADPKDETARARTLIVWQPFHTPAKFVHPPTIAAASSWERFVDDYSNLGFGHDMGIFSSNTITGQLRYYSDSARADARFHEQTARAAYEGRYTGVAGVVLALKRSERDAEPFVVYAD